jgi:hypothetical protein
MPSYSVFTSLQPPIHKRHDTKKSTAATDVWYFCRPEESATTPSEWPPPDQEQALTRRPKAPYISCKLCLYVVISFSLLSHFDVIDSSCSEWYPYKNVDGITTSICTHLKSHHGAEYDKIVRTLKLKHADEAASPILATLSRLCASKFDTSEWNQKLIKWIVGDDQVGHSIYIFHVLYLTLLTGH